LLVVIAIISMLAALLMSVLGVAKANARRIQCINNVHNLSLAWLMYAYDNTEKLVLNGQPPAGGSTIQKFWVQGQFVTVADQTKDNLLFDPNYALFANYIQARGSYLCPSDRPTVNAAIKTRSYALNPFMGWVGEWDNRMGTTDIDSRIFKKLSQIQRPSQTFTFGDVNANSICWPYFGVYMDNPGNEKIFNYPASYHERNGVLGFADAHVEAHRWHDPRTVAAKSTSYHTHDDASPGNADVAWLRDHATVPVGSN